MNHKEYVFVVVNLIAGGVFLDNSYIGLNTCFASVASQIFSRNPTKPLVELDSRNALEAIVGGQHQRPPFSATEIDECDSRRQIQS
jgi:hypothetical protein